MTGVQTCALPILAYYDIFKNYYANTQEENFYIIGNTEEIIATINGKRVNPSAINSTSTIKVVATGVQKNNIKLIVKQNQYGRTTVMTPEELGSTEVATNSITIKTTKIPAGGPWFVRSIYSTKRTSLEKYPLENLDTIRDKILLTSGDTVFDISNESMSVAPFTNFAKRTRKLC